jgi:hypothetical protein
MKALAFIVVSALQLLPAAAQESRGMDPASLQRDLQNSRRSPKRAPDKSAALVFFQLAKISSLQNEVNSEFCK